ncbi:unannotated protein [freshwater metagenome]|uniref:Unannotated protein n=1 Tax=freshwater metagenome TaxID=449393 RepID=A0A6J7B4B2_9ZZZZ|nr:hypothetical protein [Actinomycetota bacterium]
MGSGLIYAIVVVLWIAYFVPAWLRRHDQASESRSVERYRSAMRVVSRGTIAEIPLTEVERAEARAMMIRRRKSTYAILLGSFFVTLISGIAGATSLVLPLFPLIGAGYFFVTVRRAEVVHLQARRAESRREKVKIEPTQVAFQRSFQTVLSSPAESTTVHVVSRPAIRVESPASETWNPVAVPIPTYVTAPKAVRPIRTIDLTKPGVWSAAQKAAEEARLAAIAPGRDQVFDQVAAEEATEALREARAAGE